MKKLKDLLKESYVWERKFGESLPTLKQVEEKWKQKLSEGKQYGFDLTDFKRNGFKMVLKGLGIKPMAVHGSEVKGRKEHGWVWKGNGVVIVTGNNPITGEYHSRNKDGKPMRKSEKDYASYIGVEGNAKKVELAVELIKKWAAYIKNEDPKRRSYI